ncbi:thermonuclease family protein [Methanosarcina sp. KYL-1]|uniref:thermonuclease family protein n=1 Tax=Methanosarcina sp. KYL-1 TaxID=2602068 RepID=UPI002101C286|nr:thermonuclease family protein [Methanosarcina sp. KYL-1]MCQ1536095.1 thermonuclease family protein [Methanosarcina sp. KYL-1]
MRRKVTRVIDGDTFEVKTKIGDTNRVRITGYNAPELNERGGKRATKKLKDLIEGETVSLVPKARSYGRVVADVRIGRRKVSKMMKK